MTINGQGKRKRAPSRITEERKKRLSHSFLPAVQQEREEKRNILLVIVGEKGAALPLPTARETRKGRERKPRQHLRRKNLPGEKPV